MKAYPYGLACYPLDFKGIVVSPTKICLQFANPECMLRTLGNDAKMLPKSPTTHQPQLTISTDLLQLEVVAVGCQMPVLFKALEDVIQGLGTYYKTHQYLYQTTYGKPLLDDLKRLQRDITQLVENIERVQ